MSQPRISATLVIAMLVAAATQFGGAPPALAGKFIDQTGCKQCCPECKHCCRLDAEMGEVEKKCFDVETEVICIPRVVFPWQVGKKLCHFGRTPANDTCDACDGVGCSACVHNGARTRTVKILKSKKYTCPKCEYSWTAEERSGGPCCGAGGKQHRCQRACNHCGSGNCDGGCDAAYPAVSGDVHWYPIDAPAYSAPNSAGLEPVDLQHSGTVQAPQGRRSPSQPRG